MSKTPEGKKPKRRKNKRVIAEAIGLTTTEAVKIKKSTIDMTGASPLKKRAERLVYGLALINGNKEAMLEAYYEAGYNPRSEPEAWKHLMGIIRRPGVKERLDYLKESAWLLAQPGKYDMLVKYEALRKKKTTPANVKAMCLREITELAQLKEKILEKAEGTKIVLNFNGREFAPSLRQAPGMKSIGDTTSGDAEVIDI